MNLPHLGLLASVVPALWFSGCGRTVECDQNTPCPIGEQCVLGTCEVAECSTSLQCPIDTYCRNRTCIPGCESSYDCAPGYSCDLDIGECVEDGCQETAVDCGYKEFCNVATGECYDAGGTYCTPCRAATEDQDCGAGNECLNGYCMRDCSGGQECPSGFECYPFTDNAGQIVTYQCFTYCWLYEDYEPGAFAAPPPPAGTPIPLDALPSDFPPPVSVQGVGP